MTERNARLRHRSLLLAIDETLNPYHGHITFKQCNPNKPAKYGLLYRSLGNSSLPYTYYSLPYAGKAEKVEDLAATYYITGTDKYSKYLINKLDVNCNLQGINISMDRYFTSVSLATWALENNITIVGTLKHKQKGIPKVLNPVVDREGRSAMHVYNSKDKTILVSYIDKKESGKNNVSEYNWTRTYNHLVRKRTLNHLANLASLGK